MQRIETPTERESKEEDEEDTSNRHHRHASSNTTFFDGSFSSEVEGDQEWSFAQDVNWEAQFGTFRTIFLIITHKSYLIVSRIHIDKKKLTKTRQAKVVSEPRCADPCVVVAKTIRRNIFFNEDAIVS